MRSLFFGVVLAIAVAGLGLQGCGGGDDGGEDGGGEVLDSGTGTGSDAGDGGGDGGNPDAGTDAGSPDAGTPAAGTPDAGIPDAGVDAGIRGGGSGAGSCVGVDLDPVSAWNGVAPATLSATGLYRRDAGPLLLADGVRSFRPTYELWS